MGNEGFLILGGIVVVGVGAANATINNQPLTGVAVGGVATVFLLAVVATFGEGPARLSKAFMALILIAVLFNELPAILKKAGF